MSEAERKGPTPARAYASDLPLGSEEQHRIVMDRIAAGSCLECGATLTGGGEFCVACFAKYPIVENVGEPFDGWQFRVRQTKPAYMEQFYVERTDAFPPERKNKTELCCASSSKAEAVAYCEKRIARHMREAEW